MLGALAAASRSSAAADAVAAEKRPAKKAAAERTLAGYVKACLAAPMIDAAVLGRREVRLVLQLHMKALGAFQRQGGGSQVGSCWVQSYLLHGPMLPLAWTQVCLALSGSWMSYIHALPLHRHGHDSLADLMDVAMLVGSRCGAGTGIRSLIMTVTVADKDTGCQGSASGCQVSSRWR